MINSERNALARIIRRSEERSKTGWWDGKRSWVFTLSDGWRLTDTDTRPRRYIYCERMGGVVDREHLVTWAETNTHELPAIGGRHVVAPIDTISRELWGLPGTIEKHRIKEAIPGRYGCQREAMFFLSFAKPTKSVYKPINSIRLRMTGVWLRPNQII